MPREEYQQTLADLRADVCEMGDTVLDQLEDGLDALTTGDGPLGQTVIDGDAAINERYLELENDCIDLLALQQPVAGDLRFIAASFKILTDLERVADLATNLGRYAQADQRDRFEAVEIEPIGDLAREQIADAMTTYRKGDPEEARRIAARDDDLDTLCQHASEQVVRDLIEREAGADGWAVEQVMDEVSRLLLTIRDLERVGDHGVNIAARTLYLVDSNPELIY